VRGFAVVHVLGLLTSMFFWYGRQKKLKSVSIGTVWKPEAGKALAPDAGRVR